MITISQPTKYFPEEAVKFWDKLKVFSGLWEQVGTGKYLPIVVIDGENLGPDGNREEIADLHGKPYLIAGMPQAEYIGCRETEKGTFLYWKDKEGNYYEEILGVMEVERWFREIEKKNKKRASRGDWMPGEPLENST